MDPDRFDTLARKVATGTSRRRVVTGIVAGLAAPRLPGLAGDVGAATCKKTGKPCDRNSDCCDHAECPGNKCRCKKGFKDCNRKCYNLDTDEKHCGRCDTKCGAGERCCDGDCVDLDTDDGNCGSCGNPCADTEGCVGGTCVVPPGGCPPGADNCDGTPPTQCGVGAGCLCAQSTEGATMCGQPIDGVFCGACATTDDCLGEHGPGTFCAATGSTFCCGPSLQNVCKRSCPDAT